MRWPGLVAITPAAGTVGLLGAFAIGIITPVVCFFMVAVIKPKYKYDDALDAFGVHGIGGIVGSVLSGVFATQFITGNEGPQGAPLRRLAPALGADSCNALYGGL